MIGRNSAYTAAMVAFFAFAQGAHSADMGVVTAQPPAARVVTGGHCQRIWSCNGDLCGWRKVCWRGCPDRYSCAPLYGAYGPYGGQAYWSAYSYGDLRTY